MVRGWVAGNFEPSVFKTKKFEVSVKRYNKGDKEKAHFHKKYNEVTIVISGKIQMNSIEYKQDDIILISKKEVTDFLALEDSVTVVIRDGSNIKDKYII